MDIVDHRWWREYVKVGHDFAVGSKGTVRAFGEVWDGDCSPPTDASVQKDCWQWMKPGHGNVSLGGIMYSHPRLALMAALRPEVWRERVKGQRLDADPSADCQLGRMCINPFHKILQRVTAMDRVVMRNPRRSWRGWKVFMDGERQKVGDIADDLETLWAAGNLDGLVSASGVVVVRGMVYDEWVGSMLVAVETQKLVDVQTGREPPMYPKLPLGRPFGSTKSRGGV